MVFKSQIHQYLSHLHRINRPLLERPQSVRILSSYFSNLKTFRQFHPLHSFRLPRQFHFLQQSDAHNKLLWFLFYSSIYFVQFQPFQSILQHIMVTMFYRAEGSHLRICERLWFATFRYFSCLLRQPISQVPPHQYSAVQNKQYFSSILPHH